MNIDNLMTIADMESFPNGTQAIAFGVASNKDERYAFILKILKWFSYSRLKRAEKGIIIRFLVKTSGYSQQQLTRMINKYCLTGKLKREQKTTNGFKTHYTAEDIKLLAKLDEPHNTPNGLMVKKLYERAYRQYNDAEYVRLSRISVSHIYNMRQSSRYKDHLRVSPSTGYSWGITRRGN